MARVSSPADGRRARLTFEARPSDFVATLSGSLYGGGCCCCCCCCLHWITTVAGGAIGLRAGWKSAQSKQLIHSRIRNAVTRGLVVGIIGTGVVAAFTDGWIILALAPSLVFLPCLATMALSVWWADFRIKRMYQRARRQLVASEAPLLQQGAFRTAAMTTVPRAVAPELAGIDTFCRACWHPLEDAEIVLRCPKCEAPVDSPRFLAAQQGLQLTWAAGGRAFAWSSGLSIAAYIVMYLFAVIK